MNYAPKMNNAAILGGDIITCCDRTCGAFQCPQMYMKKAITGNVAAFDQQTCCEPSCGLFHCAPMGMRLKAGAGMIRGMSANICCEGRKAACIVYGDPHCDTFDKKHNDYYVSGEFWIIKHTQVKVQARYLPTHITRGLSVTKEITIGGPFMQGHILRISSTSVKLDGNDILTTFPSHYKLDGVFTVTFNDHGKILQPHRELGKNLKVLHFHFVQFGIFMQINQWTNPEEGFFVNLLVEMDALPGMDGHCGNFNGNPADDDRLEIRKRLGYNGVEQGELIGFHHKTPIDNTFEGHPTISHCASNILTAAHTSCQQEEGHYIPSMNCLVNKCQNGVAV